MDGNEQRFLTAEWRSLVMLNYEIVPAVLEPFVPAGTELDTFEGVHMVSIVGFLFLNTRVLGVPIPFHQNFEEVNLRFYVRRKAEDGWRRGVVFIREIVPRAAIAWVARALYNEPYLALPMGHSLVHEDDRLVSAEYRWSVGGTGNRVSLNMRGDLLPLVAGSEAEFITEHYWGYNRQRNGTTMEYRVEHPRWRVQDGVAGDFECNISQLYGRQFVPHLQTPRSAFLAEGSAVTVYRGRRVRE